MKRNDLEQKQTALIADYLKLQNKQVLKFNEIKSVINTNRETLRIQKNISARQIIETLAAVKILVMIELNLGARKEKRFILGQPSPYEVALLLRPGSYFTHQTALDLNGLRTKASEIIYVNSEQPQKLRDDDDLEQENIDYAFRVEQRQSRSLTMYQGREIRLLSGMNTDELGVIEKQDIGQPRLRYTDPERTLIDMTVRPAYSGGAAEVFGAYKKAISKLDLPKLIEYLDKLSYKYPYHQSIGFYLQQTKNFSPDQLKPFRELGLKHDFYLAHAMKDTTFDPSWRIHYPKEFARLFFD